MPLRKRKPLGLGTVMLLWCVGSTCLAAEPKGDPARLQKALDRAEWSWAEHEAGIFYSMSQSGFGFQIELIRPAGGWDRLTIRFVKDGKKVCSWEGHSRSVFVQKGSTLAYALFHPSSMGCKLVGVDLSSGKEIWRTELKAIGKMGHSGYSNLVSMNEADGDTVVVRGKESFGKYIEIVDLKTGKTLAHKAFKPER